MIIGYWLSNFFNIEKYVINEREMVCLFLILGRSCQVEH